jgi:hypothetical protein
MREFEQLRTCYVDEIEVDHSPTIGMGRMRVSANRWCVMAETFQSLHNPGLTKTEDGWTICQSTQE